MEKGFTVHVAELEKFIVIIKNVPCLKCGQCGETFYSGDAALKIESILKRCESIITEAAIINYNDNAA